MMRNRKPHASGSARVMPNGTLLELQEVPSIGSAVTCKMLTKSSTSNRRAVVPRVS
jgi:hypothetical protein